MSACERGGSFRWQSRLWFVMTSQLYFAQGQKRGLTYARIQATIALELNNAAYMPKLALRTYIFFKGDET